MQWLLLALLLVVKPALAPSRQVSRRLARLARLTDSALGSAFGRCALPVELPRGATWSGVCYTLHQPAARGSLGAEAPPSAAIGKAHRPKALPKAERQRDHLRHPSNLARSRASQDSLHETAHAYNIGSKPVVLARILWYWLEAFWY